MSESYSSAGVGLQVFQKRIKEQEEQMLTALDKMLAPLIEQGKEAYREYVEGEERLQQEKFSRN